MNGGINLGFRICKMRELNEIMTKFSSTFGMLTYTIYSF